MAKILLIQPNINILGKEGLIQNAPPLSLIYLGTAVKKTHTVKILDRATNSKDEYLIKILEEYTPDIIGITSMTSQMLYDIIHIGPIIKKHLKKSIILIGGVHASVDPDSVLNEPYVDFVLRGEGEAAFLEFCDTFDKNPKNLSKLRNINKNPLRPLIDLNKWDNPDFSLVNLEDYGSMWISTSRGCPGNCSFCYNARMWGINGNPCVRFLNTEKTIALFRDIIENHHKTEFSIADDNFVTFKQRCLDVCKFLENRYKGKISFFMMARADRVDDEILAALKRAGCNTITFGSESGSQRVLDLLNKQISVETQGNSIALCHKHNIFAWDSFMLGIPGETREDLDKTLKFIRKYKPDTAMGYIFTPMPGNILFDKLVHSGEITPPKTLADWARWNDGYYLKIKKNLSKIPNQEIIYAFRKLQKFRKYKTKLKKFFWRLKKGNFRFILSRLIQTLRSYT